MNKPFLYQSVVLDNQDPQMLGRVRARVLTDNYDDVIATVTNPPWNEKKDAWTSRDPFLFNPLLPYFIYQVPKVNELIFSFLYNNDYKYQNQFYFQASFSNPTLSPGEYFVGMQKWTGLGGQYKVSLELKSKDENGEYVDPPNYGVFPEPGDNAILGRGSADLIVKENEVLLRAGKTIGNIRPNIIPTANNTRAFLQLSKFERIKVLQETKGLVQNNEVITSVKYLIEWTITNPENTEDKFTGSIYLYKLKPDMKTNSAQLKVESNIEEFKSIIFEKNFTNLDKKSVVKSINDFINACNTNDKFFFGQSILEENQFPIFYRPTNSTYSRMLINPQPSTDISKNISDIYNQVKLNNSTLISGWGLIYTKDKVGIQTTSTVVKLPIYKYNDTPVTLASLGSDKICLLSHQSSIPGKGKINLNNTLYGISNDVFSDEILPKTSSMVRGEELIELINLIVRFLITHTHAFPGLPPVPITQDGSDANTILNELQNAYNKILNQNIRLN